MFSRSAILFLCLIAFLSCKENAKVDYDIIPKDEFINILVDVYLTDGMERGKFILREWQEHDSLIYKNLLQEHGYDRVLYDSTIAYYTKVQSNELVGIYDEVIKRLQQLETEARNNQNK